MSDTASESGSSCSSRLAAEETAMRVPEAAAAAEGTMAATPPGKEVEGTVAEAPGKVVEESGAVSGAGAGAGAVGGASVSSIERLLQQQRK
jgi:hypothetical protein